jgi:hypothetical protein
MHLAVSQDPNMAALFVKHLPTSLAKIRLAQLKTVKG